MNKKIPINRNGKWFDDIDFELELEMGREAIEGDLGIVVVLFKVDKELTQGDDIYHETSAEEIRFHPPVELYVVPIIEEPENKTYNNNGSLRYLEDGNLRFGIYNEQLKELETDIEYGDYIGYAINETTMKYYSVVNDGKKFHDNKHTILGYKGAFRTIEAAPVDVTEFRGI